MTKTKEILVEDVEQFIRALHEQYQAEELLHIGLVSLSPDNSVFSTVTSQFRDMFEKLAISHFGESAYETISWWFYDVEMGSFSLSVDGKVQREVIEPTFKEFAEFVVWYESQDFEHCTFDVIK